MATLSFLSYLNLSCNNFSGQIPIGTQLQSFNVSSYNGNPELCGAPLSKCSMKKNPVNAMQHRINEDDEFDEESLYLGMGVGFIVGFCGVFGSFLIFRKWRHGYFRFLNQVYDQLYVTYMVKFNNFLSREAMQSFQVSKTSIIVLVIYFPIIYVNLAFIFRFFITLYFF